MCQVGGPRCAGPVNKQRDAVRASLQETDDKIADAIIAQRPSDEVAELNKQKWALKREEQTLDAEYDETNEGQQTLLTQVAEHRQAARTAREFVAAEEARLKAEAPEGYDEVRVFTGSEWHSEPGPHTVDDPFLRPGEKQKTVFFIAPTAEMKAARDQARNDDLAADTLRRRANSARTRVLQRREALACEKAGDLEGAKAVRRHGPGAAWMAQSPLMAEQVLGGKAENYEVYPARTVAVYDTDKWGEESYSGQRYMVGTATTVIEMPIRRRGDGLYVAGEHEQAHTDALIVEELPDGTVGRVGDFDSTVRSGQKQLTVDAADWANDSDRTSEIREVMDASDDAVDVEITWDRPVIVRDEQGNPVSLRTLGELRWSS